MNAWAPRRWAAPVTLAVVFLAAQLSAFEHRLRVQHAVCAEHGEEIHVEAEPSRAQTAAFDEVSPRAVAPEHGHDHCSALLARREDLALVAGPVVALPEGRTIERAARPARVASASSSVALLRLAPKNSPPA